ncbi:MAG: Xcc1710-like domain-containing protein [Candidatus Competibacteraceae bacterium]|nr:Xcc1710-like domain-containing protein [Candidatus Competibacteraceae bacterium]
MRLNLDRDNSRNIIHAYTVGSITINEQTVERSVIVTPTRMISDWPPQQLIELEASHLAQLAMLEPEIVLLGTGARQQFPSPQVTHPLLSQGIGVEVMDTAAACRTYNIIMLEGRRIAAALFII